MTIYNCGDVALVQFPFASAAASKRRPAIVISSDDYHRSGPDVLIASITNNLTAYPHAGDHAIADWQAAGLMLPCLAQAKIATVEVGMLRRRLGRLSPEDWEAVQSGLRLALGLD
jgi:mRNA interferase MazF